jgi:ribosomal protein S13
VLDFYTESGLTRLTGCNPTEFVKFIVKETVDNALDKQDPKRIIVEHSHNSTETSVSVSDDGLPPFSEELLKAMLDFSRAPSTKRGIKKASRGALGNALQCCFGITYASWDKGLRPQYTIELCAEKRYLIHLDHDKEGTKNRFEMVPLSETGRTKLVFRLQGEDYESPRSLLATIAALNQHVNIEYLENGISDRWAAVEFSSPKLPPPEIHAYSFRQFHELLSESEGMTVTEFISQFKGLAGTKYAKAVREKAGIDGRIAVTELSEEQEKTLFESIRNSSTIPKSVHLPKVGRDALARRGYRGNYVLRSDVYHDGQGRSIPYLIEGATRPSRRSGITEAVNFTCSLGRPFSGRTYIVPTGRGYVSLYDSLKNKDLDVLIHLVCPSINWLNPSKSELERAPFDKHILDVMKAATRERRSGSYSDGEIVSMAAEILRDYPKLTFTLRQLYYRAVASKSYPHDKTSYNKFSHALVLGRLRDQLDYKRMIDMSRPEYLNDPKEPDPAKRLKGSLQELIEEFNVNAWSEQPTYIEVWIEKEALSRIILPTCKNHNVNLLVGRGYSSASQLLKAIDRFPEGRKVLVLYLGDHDPSGYHIEEKLRGRLHEYALWRGKALDLQVKRLALTYDQVERFSLPSIKLKPRSQKYAEYVARFGNNAWELDALEPDFIPTLIKNELESTMDMNLWADNRLKLEEFRREAAGRLGSVFAP